MLGATQPDALGAEAAGVGGVFAGVGVGAHAELAAADLVGPAEDHVELGRRLGGRHLHLAEHDLTARPVDGDHVAFLDDDVADGELLADDLDRFGTHDGRGPPTTRHHRGMADEAATGREDALGDHHPVDVLRARLVAHEHDLLAAVGGIDRVVGGEVHLADGGTRRRGEALGEHLAVALELRVQHGVEVVRGHPHHGFTLGELPLRGAAAGALRHVDSHPQRGAAGALADAGLEHPQLALLDRELGVAHVAVVALEALEDREQLVVDDGEVCGERVEVLGVADAGDDVFALGLDQEVAVRPVLAGRRVAREPDAGTRVVVAVPEHHRLHVDGRAEVVADALAHPVGDRPGTVPRPEDRLDGSPQLGHRLLRERLAGVGLDDVLVVGGTASSARRHSARHRS